MTTEERAPDLLEVISGLYGLFLSFLTLKLRKLKQSLPYYKEAPLATYVVIREYIMRRGHVIESAVLKRFDIRYKEAIDKNVLKYDGKYNRKILEALFEICSSDIIAFPFLRRRLIEKGLDKYSDKKINWDLTVKD